MEVIVKDDMATGTTANNAENPTLAEGNPKPTCTGVASSLMPSVGDVALSSIPSIDDDTQSAAPVHKTKAASPVNCQKALNARACKQCQEHTSGPSYENPHPCTP